MIYYVIAEHNKKICDEYIRTTIPLNRSVFVQDSIGRKSMMKKYNDGISELESMYKLSPDDVIVFVHEDVKLMDIYFENKITNYFKKYKDLGVAGVYGSVSYNGGGWWNHDRPKNARGHIIQGGPDGLGSFPMVENRGNHFDIVVADGCMLAVRYDRLLKGKFRDNEWEGYHHYDNSFCLDTLLYTDYKVAVLDITIYHASIGELDEGWVEVSNYLKNHYMNLGLNFPIDINEIKRWKTSKET